MSSPLVNEPVVTPAPVAPARPAGSRSPSGVVRLDVAPAGQAAPWWRRTLRQAGFEIRIALRNGEQLIVTLVLPVLVLIGVARTTSLELGGGDRISLALGGALALAVVSTSFTGQAIATGFDRRNGVLRLLATTPLGRSGLLAGKVLAVLALVVLQLVVLGAVATVLGWQPSPVGLVLATPALLLGVAAFTALGLLLAGTVRAEGTLAVANLIWILLLAGGGLVLPSALPAVTDLLPSGALGTALTQALSSHSIAIGPLLVLTVWAVLASLACARWFRWE